MKAYSEKTNKTYDSWDALVAAEANGYHVIVVATYATGKRKGEVAFANSTGNGKTKQQARNKASAMRQQAKDENRSYNYRFFVRPSWR